MLNTKESKDAINEYAKTDIDIHKFYVENCNVKSYITLLQSVFNYIELVEDFVKQKEGPADDNINLRELKELENSIIAGRNIIDLDSSKEIIKTIARVVRYIH